MYECKRIAVIQRGKSGNCFPAEICEGESARSCEARVFPPRAPPFWARFFGAYVVVCVTFLVGRWIRQYRGRQAEPMDEGGRESGPRSGPVHCVFGRRVFVNMIKCVIIMGDMM